MVVENMGVEEGHSYFVGREGVLVHNLSDVCSPFFVSIGLDTEVDNWPASLLGVVPRNFKFAEFASDLERAAADVEAGGSWGQGFLDYFRYVDGGDVGEWGRRVRAWEFLFDGAGIRVKPNVLESISTALQRGVKDIPNIVNHANHPNIVTRTVEHIFRGHGTNGGRHHISALISDNSRKLVDRLKETSDGFYEAVIKRSDGSTSRKSFWPDTWDENRVMDELKHVMANNPVNVTGNTWEGFTTTGQKVHYYLKSSDNTVISAFPVLD